jgi:hypothetical protein
MSVTTSRWTRLAALGAGLATAAAITLAASGSALADPVDGTGTATITFSTKFLAHLAQWGIIVIPENPATSSDTAGYDAFTTPVTGGNGSDTNFSGDVNLGGGLTIIDATTGQAVHFTSLELDYFDGVITGVPEGTTTTVWIADIAGNLATSNATGTETFTASQLALDPAGVTYLNTTLKSTTTGPKNHKTYSAFTAGTNTSGKGAFTITYAVTIT